MANILSNPDLDELYSIRRILVGRCNASQKISDAFAVEYYTRKVNAMDKAIAAFIEAENVPPEHVEQRIPTGPLLTPRTFRIPGEEDTKG